jgi:signal peptidase I
MAEQRRTSTPRRALHSDSDSFASDPSEPEELSFGQHAVAFGKELAGVVVGAVIVAALLRAFVGQMFIIPSVSMENTLQKQDRVVVEKLSSVRRGEVVVFADPGGWLRGPPSPERGPIGKALQFVGVLPDTSTKHLIKRVIGMPGDTVVCCDDHGRVSVNGRPLDETSYLRADADGQVAPSKIPFRVVVPADHFFVMGDNRIQSADSRCHLNSAQGGLPKGQNAFVSEDLVVGRAIAVVWPFPRKHRLPVPDTFATVPTGAKPAPGTASITAGPEANC